MSTTAGVRLAPRVGLEPVGARPATDPFVGFFESLFEPQGALQLPGPGTLFESLLKAAEEAAAAEAGVKLPSKEGAPTPSAPTGGGGGKEPVKPDDFARRKPPVKPSDFKTAAKIAAGGAAATAAGLGLNEAAKQLGDTLNDAVGTTGKVIENAAEGIGKGLDNAGKAVGDAFSFVLDPLGLSDEDKKNFGKLLLIGGAVAVGLLVLYMVVKK